MKNIRSAKKPEKKRLNFLDILLILLLLCSLAGIAFRVYTMREKPLGNDAETVVSFRTDALIPEVAEVIAKEQSVLLFDQYTATVMEAEVKPVPVPYAKDGAIIYLPSLLKKRVEGKLLLHGASTPNGFFLGGKTYFVPGSEADAVGENAYFRLYVTEIA